MEYEFTVIFAIDKCGKSTADIVDLLGEAGFTDTLIGLGKPGHVAVQFSHKAASYDVVTQVDAVRAVVAAVKAALPGVELVELLRQDCDGDRAITSNGL